MGTNRADSIASATYLVRSLLAIPENERTRTVGPGAKPWCEILDQLTRSMRRDLRPVVVPLLSTLIWQADALTPDQRAFVGLASRRMLEFAWSEASRDAGMIHCAIEGVCRTFKAAPTESASVLRRMLEPNHLAANGYDELPTLARELKWVLASDPDFVEDVFRVAVSFREESDDATEIGGPSILGRLRSNRRQDYEMVHHALGEFFPSFMAAAPVEATGAVIAAVECHLAEHATKPVEDIASAVIPFGEGEVRFTEDISCIWDETEHRLELHHLLLDGFEEGLVQLAEPEGNTVFLHRVLDRVRRENRFAAVWRRVLSASIRQPSTLGLQLSPLVTAAPVLIADDTVGLVETYLQVVFPLLESPERETIECAILSIESLASEYSDLVAQRRDRLLSCLPAEYLVSNEAKEKVQELKNAGGPSPEGSLYRVGEPIIEEFSEDDWLASQEVDMSAEANQHLRAMTYSVADFSNRFMNQGPTREEATAILPDVRDLHQMLAQDVDGVDPLVSESSWTHLAGACAGIANAVWLEKDEDIFACIQGILLKASDHESPQCDPARDQQHEDHEIVYPSPRLHAAGGLIRLARCPALIAPEVVSAIRKLGEDPCADVRSEVVRHISALYSSQNVLFWEVLRRIETSENNRRIIHYTLCGVRHLAKQHREELLEVASSVFNRFRLDTGASEIRCDCLSIVIHADASGENPYGSELINVVICDMATFTDEAAHLVRLAASALTLGPIDPPDPQKDRFRLASFAFLRGTARAVQEWLGQLEFRLDRIPRAEWPPETQPQIEATRKVAHELAFRTYIASRSFDEKQRQESQRKETTRREKARFLQEATSLLDLLVELGLADVVHNCLQTLSSCVPINPRDIFLAVGRAVRHGERRGYQFDSLAANLVVGIVRRYIADYRSLFREDTDCRDVLVEVLNIFLRAGWPEAINLTCRFDEVFR